jgi:uncharacterized membrane protein
VFAVADQGSFVEVVVLQVRFVHMFGKIVSKRKTEKENRKNKTDKSQTQSNHRNHNKEQI